jgi:hypothetical protein
MRSVKYNYITPHAQNTTALLPNIFLSGIHQLLVTYKKLSAFPGANNCQGQLQTPQSALVFKTLSSIPTLCMLIAS